MSEVDLRHVRAFLAVAEESSITRAAARMYLTQQALSRQIQILERALGVTLLVRSSRGVLLTAAGEELAAGARILCADVRALVQRVRATARKQSGSLRLVCCPYATTLFTLEVAGAMETAVPGIEVDVTSVATHGEEVSQLIAGEADAAFMWLPAGDDRLDSAPLHEDQRVVAVPETHELAGRSSVSITELADEPVVIGDFFFSEETTRYWIADPRPDGRPAPRGPVVSSMEDCLMQVKRGRGIWLAPEPLARWAGNCSGVRWIPVTGAETFQMAVVWPPHAPTDLVAALVAQARSLGTDAAGTGSVEAGQSPRVRSG
ncbi:MAG TPA: LysR family transcriptional regulator [Trebonia sp.]